MGQSEKLWSKSFIVLTASYLLLFLSLQMLLSPFPAYVKDRFHPGDFTVSLVTSLFALAAIGTRLAIVPVLRRVHRNVVLFVGLLIAAVATILYGLAGSIGAVLALRVLFGIGFGMASTVMPTLVSQIIPKLRLGEGIGYFGLSTSMAMSFGPMIGLSVMDGLGFKPLTVLGTLSVVLIVPLLLLTRSVPPQPAKTPVHHLEHTGEPVKPPRYINRKIALPALLNTLLSLTYGSLLGFLALYGKEIHLGQIGLFFLFNAITVLIIRPISGRLFDSKGPVAVLIPSGVAVFGSLLLLSYVHSLPLLVVSALLYGLGFGAIQPATQAWMLRESPSTSHGAVNSLYYNSIDLGVAAGSMLLGIVASHTGYAVMYRWASCIMLLFLVVFLVGRMLSAGRQSAK
ncbi:MFS transporter [Paenibacillus physcomitrellae]|uniref:MFS transporter n=1 Tax=Paenibacillus physcomitrellae TaxID=1619311 RepID=UPI001FD1B70C|nr:MFS transporter [Paenibacillus physcomitrellae]